MPKAPQDFKISDPAEMAVSVSPAPDRHPGLFIRDTLLPEYGLNISRLCEVLKLNRSNVSAVLSGKSDVSRDFAYRLGALLNDHLADLLINWQHLWTLEQERPRRQELAREIERLPAPAAAV